MKEKYNLGLAAFISVIASASFVCGYLTMYWVSANDKDENKEKYQEMMHYITKQEIYPDLFNIRMKLSMLKAIDSGEETDWSTIKKLFTDELIEQRKELAFKIGTLPKQDWDTHAEKLAIEIDEYLLEK